MMIKRDIKTPLKNFLIIAGIALALSVGFVIYDSKEPFVKPLFTKQISPSCPYYKDFLGRVFYRYSYYPSSLFTIGPVEKRVQYNWHKVKNISNRDFKVERVLPELEVRPESEMQKVCIAYDGYNVIYNNYVFANADINTFEVLENFFYKDKNTVYYSNGKVVPGADTQTFEVLTTDKCTDSQFARDKDRFYEANNVIEQERIEFFVKSCAYE